MFASPLITVAYKPNEFVLAGDLIWTDYVDNQPQIAERIKGWKYADVTSILYTIRIPRGYVTDFASLPKFVELFYDVNGPSRQSAVLHDFLYSARWLSRKLTDTLFYDAMRQAKISRVQCSNFYWGVRLGGWAHWDWRASQLPVNAKEGHFIADDFAPIEFMNSVTKYLNK